MPKTNPVFDFLRELHEQCPTAGSKWRKADCHFHSRASHDSTAEVGDMIDRLVSTGHDMAVLTDHNQMQAYEAARNTASKKGLVLLPGAEIHAKVPAIQESSQKTAESYFHLLVVLDPDVPKLMSRFENLITNNRPEMLSEGNRKGIVVDLLNSETFMGFSQRVHESHGLIIPAHLHADPSHPHRSRSIDDVFSDKLFLKWVVACRFDALEVLDTKTAAYFDGHHTETGNLRISCIRSSDAHKPEEIGRRSTWLKMEDISYDGFRLALQDRDTRVALSDPGASRYHRILGARIRGRFFEDQWVRFNDDLNCVIGAKGKGKSALLESLRFALNIRVPEIESSTRERQKFQNRNHALLDNVLGPNGSVQCIVESSSGTKYLFQRSRNDASPTITSETDCIEKAYYDLSETFGCRFYGWEELTSCSEELNLLTDVFDAHFRAEGAGDGDTTLPAIQRALSDNQRQLDLALADVQSKRVQLEEYLSADGEINSLIARLESESRGRKDLRLCIEHQEACSSEESLLSTTEEYLGLKPSVVLVRTERATEHVAIGEATRVWPKESDPSGDDVDNLRDLHSGAARAKRSEVRRAFEELCKLYASIQTSVRTEWRNVSPPLLSAMKDAIKEYREALQAEAELLRKTAGIASQSDASRKLDAIRKLQNDISARKKQIRGKNAETLRNQLSKAIGKYVGLMRSRRRLFTSITSGRASVAAELSRKYAAILKADFRARCQFDEFRNGLRTFFTNSGLQYNVIIDTIVAKRIMPETFCIFLLNWKEGAVMRAFDLSQDQAEKLFKHTYGDLSSRVKPFHGVAVADVPEVKMLVDPSAPAAAEEIRYRLVSKLSAGERSTVVLPLVTHGTADALVIDQPEDDLDNAYIHESFVHNVLRKSKSCRQFIFATHNANIPVLGDAENVIALEASREKGRIQAQGCTDSVADQVMDVLEGGRQAFIDRSTKYGVGPCGHAMAWNRPHA